MKPGDIVEGTSRRRSTARHYIVFLEDGTDGAFAGAVLTHSARPDNFPMDVDHFKKIDNNGEKFKFEYENTFVVGQSFIKPLEWGPYIKVGELTNEGLKYIKKILSGKTPVRWDDYVT